jgi:hypothetical protein
MQRSDERHLAAVAADVDVGGELLDRVFQSPLRTTEVVMQLAASRSNGDGARQTQARRASTIGGIVVDHGDAGDQACS